MSRVKWSLFVIVFIAMVGVSWLLGYVVLAADAPRLSVLVTGIAIGTIMNLAWAIFWHYVPTARNDAPYHVPTSEHGFTPNRDYFDPAPPEARQYIQPDWVSGDTLFQHNSQNSINIANPTIGTTKAQPQDILGKSQNESHTETNYRPYRPYSNKEGSQPPSIYEYSPKRYR